MSVLPISIMRNSRWLEESYAAIKPLILKRVGQYCAAQLLFVAAGAL